MISGNFGDEDELFFEIDLIAADGLELPLIAEKFYRKPKGASQHSRPSLPILSH